MFKDMLPRLLSTEAVMGIMTPIAGAVALLIQSGLPEWATALLGGFITLLGAALARKQTYSKRTVVVEKIETGLEVAAKLNPKDPTNDPANLPERTVQAVAEVVGGTTVGVGKVLTGGVSGVKAIADGLVSGLLKRK
jgi:hypothetical protein